jgi:nucleotide-binding universal stress UspA family protein
VARLGGGPEWVCGFSARGVGLSPTTPIGREPTLVPRETQAKEVEMSSIVVGVDGSEGSVRALRFAIDEARSRGDDVRAVCAWGVPTLVYESVWASGAMDPAEYRGAAEGDLAKALAEVNADESGVVVKPVVREGQAASVLCEEARDAELLVVGSRGLGGFRGLLLGSVSQQCAQHARCPVAIVPAAEARAA